MNEKLESKIESVYENKSVSQGEILTTVKLLSGKAVYVKGNYTILLEIESAN